MTDCFLSGDRLSAYADGSLAESDRAGVEQHLAQCARCRGELEWLRSLARDTAALPRALAPSRELWDGIAPRLERRRRFIKVESRMLAVAAIVLMVLSAGLTALYLRNPRQPGPVATTGGHPVILPARSGGEAAALAALIAQVRQLELSLPPEASALVATQLSQIDAAIRESEAALAGAKDNPAIAHMLAARYQQRLMLLEQARRVARSS